jgi:SecD/SecF fusion protein
MKKNKGILILAIIVFMIAGLGYTSAVGFGSTGTGAAKNINLGLDLAGGVSITYQAVGETPTAEQMSDTIYKLQKRVENYSTESMLKFLVFLMQMRFLKNLVNQVHLNSRMLQEMLF